MVDSRTDTRNLARDQAFLTLLRGLAPRLHRDLLAWADSNNTSEIFASLLNPDQARGLLGLLIFSPHPESEADFKLVWNRIPIPPAYHRRFLWKNQYACHVVWFSLPVDGGRGVFAIDGKPCTAWRAGKPLREVTFQDLAVSFGPEPTAVSYFKKPLDIVYDLWFNRKLRHPATRERYHGCWLFADRDFKADDNAEHFYRWLARHHPERKIYFALRRGVRDWQRLAAENFRLIDLASSEYRCAYLHAEWLISSNLTNYLTRYRWRYRYKSHGALRFAFLQHGVTKDYNTTLTRVPIDLYLTAAAREYHAYAEDPAWAYPLSAKETVLTGFPRHDALLARGGREEKKLVLCMPTWRSSLMAPFLIPGRGQFFYSRRFAASEFFRQWRLLLTHPLLTEAARKHGLEICLFLHPLIQKQARDFEAAGLKIFPSSTASLQDALARTAVLLTDYSSVAFEAALIECPMVYFQVDRDSFFSENQYRPGYFDYRRDGFGDVADNRQAAAERVAEILADGGRMAERHRKRARAFFAYRDGGSCRRVYEALLAHSGPANSRPAVDFDPMSPPAFGVST